MIEKIICETDENYEKLTEERKIKYQEIWKSAVCCPDKYILSVDFASPTSKDYSVAIKLNYEEYLKGYRVVESIEHF